MVTAVAPNGGMTLTHSNLAAPPKPLLRGWSHLIAFLIALVSGTVLIAVVAPGRARLVALIYSVCLAALFGISALYHRPNWSPRARRWMRRLDHTGIFLMIAGTFTPYSMALPPKERAVMLTVGWVGAALGALRALVWINAPKPVAAIIYLALGWAPLMLGKALFTGLGARAFGWLIAGGALYSAGTLCYALKRPRLWPRVFGYHEVFHLFVILAAAAHFVGVAEVLERLG